MIPTTSLGFLGMTALSLHRQVRRQHDRAAPEHIGVWIVQEDVALPQASVGYG